MKPLTKKYFFIAICLLAVFALLTLILCRIDVRPIGPLGSSVGCASLNRLFHELTGVHMFLYILTDWPGLVPVGFAFGFALLGLIQWIRRRHILKVDHSILILGGFYLHVMAAYLLFEELVINYRPILINGFLEASYPSSTTLLVLCIMSTAILQLRTRIKNKIFRSVTTALIAAFAVFMVIGRLISGVHWLTDIAGGILLSAGLVMLYAAFLSLIKHK